MNHFSSNDKTHISLAIVSSICIGIIVGLFIYPRIRPSAHFSPQQIQFESNKKLDAIMGLIQAEYVDTINNKELTEKTIPFLLEQLDPHSAYIPATDFQAETEALQGNFEGIGIQFRMQNDTLYVVTPVAGGPSEKAGLLSGDRIITINDTLVAGIKIPDKDIIHKLKGKKGTKVKVGIRRNGFTKLISYTITRDVIPTFSIDYSGMLSPKIGYIKLNRFSRTTYDEYVSAIKKVRAEGMQTLILDLRGNGGGFLDQAVKIADDLLDKDNLIVYTQGRKRQRMNMYSKTRGSFVEGDLYIIIDEFSASASEILAGALQDNDRGTIVGRRSFGKGLVQEQFEMRDESALRLTVARYYTPSGRCIQKPYGNGNESYFSEYAERIQSGELESLDSIHLNDTTKYRTKNGRIVYGGGGIIPDVFIPYEKDSLMPYYNDLLRKGLIHKFCFDYVDRERSNLLKSYQKGNYIRNFQVSDNLFQSFILYTEEQGVKKNAASLNKFTPELKILMKAYIGQNLFDDEVFYATYIKIDKELNQTLQLIKEKGKGTQALKP